MHSQHTSALNSTHMCVDAVCRIARNFGRRSYVKREKNGPFMSASHNLWVRRKYMRQLMRPEHIRCIQATHRCVGPCIDDSRLFETGEKEVRRRV